MPVRPCSPPFERVPVVASVPEVLEPRLEPRAAQSPPPPGFEDSEIDPRHPLAEPLRRRASKESGPLRYAAQLFQPTASPGQASAGRAQKRERPRCQGGHRDRSHDDSRTPPTQREKQCLSAIVPAAR
jgi:hypothetical protein